MIRNPAHALNNGWVTSPDLPINEDEQLQQNGIDLRVKTVYKLPIHKPFRYLRSGKQALDLWQCEGGYREGETTFLFDRAIPYQVECYEYIRVPRGMCAMVFSRSTFNRNGIIIRSCLFDAGFKNFAAFAVYPFVPMEIHQGIRIAQIVFMDADSHQVYNGQYQDGN